MFNFFWLLFSPHKHNYMLLDYVVFHWIPQNKMKKISLLFNQKKINHRNWDVNESWLTELTYGKKQQQIFRYAKQINFFLIKNFKMKFCKILCLKFSVFFWLTYDIDQFFWFWGFSKLFWLFSYEKLTWWPDSAKTNHHTHILYMFNNLINKWKFPKWNHFLYFQKLLYNSFDLHVTCLLCRFNSFAKKKKNTRYPVWPQNSIWVNKSSDKWWFMCVCVCNWPEKKKSKSIFLGKNITFFFLKITYNRI